MDEEILNRVEQSILSRIHGLTGLRLAFPELMRRAVDEVIDAPRSGRLTFRELEPTEKTYLGTKIEILVRNLLKLERGVLDLDLDGLDVDIKNTTRGDWMIPREAFGMPCIVISSNEQKALCDFGIVVAHFRYLRPGHNQDKKFALSASGKKQIRWLLKDEPYPKNFFETIDRDLARSMMMPRGGTDRIVQLFTLLQNRPIPRHAILSIAPQKDSMKRVRKNGGARDALTEKGIEILSGQRERSLIADLGLPNCTKDEFLSLTPSPRQRVLIETFRAAQKKK
ncbi:NaeI family type II restriction endonuclease [Hyphomicrobium facile]|uniref:Restriction endonuclease NaeI n=1 Tax=Hyphomicrobium facile TaxID=51670 RepID=A0A1I7NH41_9HYPH|nr:NaeI family type II restriction endonuclease [Hyphomicrobium facile]SFV33972.1 Restriction endonuclease NaeI [Hyphomicrobium facile]